MKDPKCKLLKLTNMLFVLMTLAIACTTILLFILTQKNKNDGYLINISGQQRYLSQKISKTCLIIVQNTDSIKINECLRTLETDLQKFKTNNKILHTSTYSQTVLSYLDEIQPLYEIICSNVNELQNDRTKGKKYLNNILDVEPLFLQHMIRIVSRYEIENKTAINHFLFFLILSNILLILALIFFIFKIIKPAIIINKANQEVITEQRNMLVQLNNDKDIFISILAHDLRSPFTSILGFLQILEDNVNSNDIKETESQIKLVNDSAKNVYNLLESLLSWVRIQSGKMPFSPQKLQLSAMCDETIKLLKNNGDYKNIALEQSVDDDIIIYADKDMITAVLRNLVSNAIKFTESGGYVKINAELKDNLVIVTVSDTGIGMNSEILNKLFNKSNLNTTIGTNNEKGSGLGLLLCKDFVEKHNGTIWAESEVGIGSNFKFTIPYMEHHITSKEPVSLF